MKKAFLLFSFLFISGVVSADPKPVKEAKKTYYNTPIKEFKGAVFFQWKKYDLKPVAAVQHAQTEIAEAPAVKGEKIVSVSVKND